MRIKIPLTLDEHPKKRGDVEIVEESDDEHAGDGGAAAAAFGAQLKMIHLRGLWGSFQVLPRSVSRSTCNTSACKTT